MRFNSFKNIFLIFLTGFLFFNFTSAALAVTTCTKENAKTCCAKTYGTYLVDANGCNKDPYCISNSAFFTQCASKTSEQGQEIINPIVSLSCPAGSYPYTPNASDSVLRNFLSELDKSVFGTTGLGDSSSAPQGCLSDKQGTTCLDKNRQAVDANDSSKQIGCWVAPLGVIRQGDEIKDAFNSIDWSMGWLGLISGSKLPNEYKVIVDIPCDNAIVNIIGGASCADTKSYTNSISLYVTRLYQFGFGIVGAAALLMIIIGAAKYTLSAGSFTSKDEAKKDITQAVYGILLLFGAYIILYTINPGLVTVTTPTIDKASISNLSAPTTAQTTTNTNTPTENLGTTYYFIENCETTKNSTCIKCSNGYVLISGKCEKSTLNVGCGSGYGGPTGCIPCSNMNGYNNNKGGCVFCSDGNVVSGEAPNQKCVAE